MDLNGITADLSKENHYYGLNRFKMGFNPDVYEYIGEFDLVIDEKQYEKYCYIQKKQIFIAIIIWKFINVFKFIKKDK